MKTIPITFATQIQRITPYCRNGVWQFDDAAKGLRGEIFVPSVSPVIEHLTQDIPRAQHGFNLLFASFPFPGHTLAANRQKPKQYEFGTYYQHEQTKLEFWLCPALLHYFTEAPKALYAQALALNKPISRR